MRKLIRDDDIRQRVCAKIVKKCRILLEICLTHIQYNEANKRYNLFFTILMISKNCVTHLLTVKVALIQVLCKVNERRIRLVESQCLSHDLAPNKWGPHNNPKICLSVKT